MLLALTSCSPDRVASSNQDPRQSEVATTPVKPVAPGDFTRDPGFALPAQVERSTQPAPLMEKSRLLTSDDVKMAVLRGMGADAGSINVQVQAGMVSLTGEVASVADLQRANYLARAVEGVIEVDQSGLRVRR